MLSAIVKNRSLTAQSRMAPAAEIAAQSVEIVLPSSKHEKARPSRRYARRPNAGRPNDVIDTSHRFQRCTRESQIVVIDGLDEVFREHCKSERGLAIGGMLERKQYAYYRDLVAVVLEDLVALRLERQLLFPQTALARRS